MRALVLVAALAIVPVQAIAQNTDPQIWSGVVSASQAERGSAVFVAQCARCHGQNRSLSDDVFMLHWEGLDLGRLFRKIKDTMPPGGKGGLTDAETLDSLAYILQQNRFPDGPLDLTHDDTTLEAIRILPRGGPRPTNATEPAPTMLEKSRDLQQDIDRAMPRRTQTFQLLSPYPNPAPHAGHKVEVKGLLIRHSAGDRINVLALAPLPYLCD